MAVHFQSDGRIAVSHVFAHRLYRHVLRQKQAAISMPQAVASNMTESILIFKLCEEVSDAVRVNRLAVVIDDQVILFEMLVELFIGKAEPIHIKFKVCNERVRERNIALRLLRFRLFLINAELVRIHTITADMGDFLFKVYVRPFQPAHFAVAHARQKHEFECDLFGKVIQRDGIELCEKFPRLRKGKDFLFVDGTQSHIAFFRSHFRGAYGIFTDPFVPESFIEYSPQNAPMTFDGLCRIRLSQVYRFKVFGIIKPVAVAYCFRRFLFNTESLLSELIAATAVDDVFPFQLSVIYRFGKRLFQFCRRSPLVTVAGKLVEKQLHIAYCDFGYGFVVQMLLREIGVEQHFEVFCTLIVVEIYAAALNRADLLQREGNYPPPPGCPEWPGLEVAGVIKEVAQNVKRWKIGDRVCALLGGGGYAEYVAVSSEMVMPMPKGLSYIEAAAIPEVYMTAYLNLFYVGEAKSGETLLMNAGASGLASAVIPMASLHARRTGLCFRCCSRNNGGMIKNEIRFCGLRKSP